MSALLTMRPVHTALSAVRSAAKKPKKCDKPVFRFDYSKHCRCYLDTD